MRSRIIFTSVCGISVIATTLLMWSKGLIFASDRSLMRGNWTALMSDHNSATGVLSQTNSGHDSKSEANQTKPLQNFYLIKNVTVPGLRLEQFNVDKSAGAKFLIYTCTAQNSLCGGWGDRQEGLVTVFLLANLTNRRFGIRLTSPCDLQKFLEPSLYNWVVKDEEIQGKSTRQIPAIDRSSFSAEMPTLDFNAKYTEDVVFLHTNRDLLADITANPHYRDKLPQWARQRRPQFFSYVWRTLMKPSPHMQQRLDAFLRGIHYENRTRPLFGVHVRTGQSAHFADADFGDRISILGPLWDFLQPYVKSGSEVFIATDNPKVREISLSKFGSAHHDTHTVLRHIDRQRGDPEVCQSFEGAILDQMILILCDVLVVTGGSGFSGRAAMVRGLSEQLFQLGNPRILPADLYGICDPIC